MLFFPYLEMWTRPWKQYPNIISIFFYNFSLFYCYFSFDKSHTFYIWKWAMDPENRRTLQPQESIYKQKKIPPIVKKNNIFFFLKLGPQTPLVVQEHLSRAKMYSVVWQASLWHTNQKDLFSSETMKYICFRVLASKKIYLVQKIDSVVKPWNIFNSEFWHHKIYFVQKNTLSSVTAVFVTF